MSETKFTPGPWEWITDSGGPEDVWGCETPSPVDLETWEHTGYSGNPLLYPQKDGYENIWEVDSIIDAGHGEYCPFHKKEDAYLIEAAPELYSELERIFLEYTDELTDEDQNQIDRLLAKARGESPQGNP